MKKLIVLCAVSALLGGAVAGWLFDSHTNLLAPASAQELRAPVRASIPLASASLAPNAGLTQEELTNIRVYDGANRGVVNVLTKMVSHDRFFMLPSPAEGAGSGSVLDKQGHILTNYHVVEDANKVWVTLPGGKDPFEGEIVGVDPDNDIAVLKIAAPPEELFGWAKELRAPVELVQEVAERGELPVPLFCAGGIATPADAALVMQLGAQAVFVGSGIFKSDDPAPRAKAIVEATTHYADASIVTKVSRGLGAPMRGDEIDTLDVKLAERGW